MPMPTNDRKFTVSMAVDGRINVEVVASGPLEAMERAKEAFVDADLSEMETVDARPVNAYDHETKWLTDAP